MARAFHGRTLLFKWHRRSVAEGKAPPRRVLWEMEQRSGGGIKVWSHAQVKGDYHTAVGITDDVARAFMLRYWPGASIAPIPKSAAVRGYLPKPDRR